MKFAVTIEVEDSIIKNIVKETVREAFEKTSRYSNPPLGYRIIQEQVMSFLERLDLSEHIQEEASLLLQSGIVKDVTEASIRRHIKKTVADMRKKGELFTRELTVTTDQNHAQYVEK
jgi:translation initiation factor 2 beta subunit (eIF-2beta)/eIF-5